MRTRYAISSTQERFFYRVNPVRVKNAQVASAAADALLGDALEVALELQLVHALVLRLSVHHALVNRALPATAADSHAVKDKPGNEDSEGERNSKRLEACPHSPLLGLVAEAVGLVRPGGLVHTADLRQLAVLPRAHTEEKAEHIALLLAP